MGHQRLGRLPRTRRWAEVAQLLTDSPNDDAKIAAAAIHAAQRRLDELPDETAVPYCFWLLTQLTWAARGEDFVAEFARLGVPVVPGESAFGYIVRLSDEVSDTLMRVPGAGAFADLAIQSFRHALAETVGSQGPSLFESTFDDLRRAFRRYSTEKGFATLARQFFGDFVARTLRYFLDREIANRIGPESGLATIDDARECAEAVDHHARETARYVEVFAGEWYSKRNWLSDGAITRNEARGFVGQAMEKLRSELVREAQVA